MSAEVSVVIIFLNEERFLAAAIESVLGQTLAQWELILVDDGSTDASRAIAEAYASRDARIRVVEHPGGENRGMSASRNLGLVAATAPLIAFLDADDVFLPEKLSLQVATLAQHPEAVMTYGPLLRWHRWTGVPEAYLHEDLCGVGRRKRGPHPFGETVVAPPALVELMARDDYFCPSGGLIRTEVLRSVGGFEEQFTGLHEDGVAMAKLCLQYPVHVSNEVTYLYRMHAGSCTQQTGHAEAVAARRTYLRWLDDHVTAHGSERRVQRAIRRAEWSLRVPLRRAARRTATSLNALVRWSGRRVIPLAQRDALRRAWRSRRAAIDPTRHPYANVRQESSDPPPPSRQSPRQ